MGTGVSSTGGVWEQGLEAWGLRGDVEERLNDFFLCLLDLPDLEDDDFDLDNKRP